LRPNFVFFITLLLSSIVRLAYAETALWVEVLPSPVKQGGVCLIRAAGATPINSVYGEFRREKFAMVSEGQNGAYSGLLGIDMETRAATYEIKVGAIDESWRVYSSALSLKVEGVDFGTQKLSLPRSMVDLDAKSLERVNKEARRLELLFQGLRDERLWSGAFLSPLRGEISAVFGIRRILNGQQRSRHAGIDLRAEEGTPVLASNSGIVVLVDELFFSGRSVIVDHGWGIYSMYFHLSDSLVREGDRIRKGATVGRVGSTGRSTGPHLHWGIRMKGARVDPLSLVRSTEHLIE
jgi:murein DD-endopeptidase MepM/ murein hydrolase activator NlpD